MEIFETDMASDEESRAGLSENDKATREGERGGNYGDLVRGEDIIDDAPSFDNTY